MQVVEVEIEETVVAAEEVNFLTVDDCGMKRSLKLINWICKSTRNLHKLMNSQRCHVMMSESH